MLAKPRLSTVPTAYFQPRGIQLPAVSGRGQLVCPGHPQRYGDGYVIDAAGHKVSLPRGSSDAALLPYHVERSILFVLDRIAVAVPSIERAPPAGRRKREAANEAQPPRRFRRHSSRSPR